MNILFFLSPCHVGSKEQRVKKRFKLLHFFLSPFLFHLSHSFKKYCYDDTSTSQPSGFQSSPRRHYIINIQSKMQSVVKIGWTGTCCSSRLYDHLLCWESPGVYTFCHCPVFKCAVSGVVVLISLWFSFFLSSHKWFTIIYTIFFFFSFILQKKNHDHHTTPSWAPFQW